MKYAEERSWKIEDRRSESEEKRPKEKARLRAGDFGKKNMTYLKFYLLDNAL